MVVDITRSKNDPTILIFRAIGNWHWKDIQRKANDTRPLANISSDRIDLIVDLSQSMSLPCGSLNAAHQMIQSAPIPSVGCIVVVASDDYILAMVATFARIFPDIGGCFHTCKTVREAQRIIAKDRKGESTPTT